MIISKTQAKGPEISADTSAFGVPALYPGNGQALASIRYPL